MLPIRATSRPLVAEDGRGQRRRGALPLGAGDGHHPGVGEVLQPEGHGRGHHHPGGPGGRQLGAVPAHTRGPDHHVDVDQSTIAGGDAPAPVPTDPGRGRPRRRSSIRTGDAPLRPAGRPWPAPLARCPRWPPGGRTGRPGSRRLRPKQRSTAAATSGSGKARSVPGASNWPTSSSVTRARARSARAATTGVPLHSGRIGQHPDGRGRLAPLPHALERLVVVAHQGGESGDLPGVGEHVPPDDGGHRVGLQERGQHEADEPALRTVPAPAVPGPGGLAEHRVAAAERGVVAGQAGEGPGDGQLRVRAAGPSRRSGRDRWRRRSARRSRRSNSRLFEYWWLTGTPSTITVSSLAERSTAMAMVS